MRQREDAQWARCAPQGSRSATHLIVQWERFWTESLDRLADLLADLNEEDDTDDDGPTDNR